MALYEQDLHSRYDARIATLGKIKSRSIDADALTLSALNVLTYAQLEGGLKELASRAIKDVNKRGKPLGTLSPALLKWRNASEISQVRSALSFDNVADQFPLALELGRIVNVKDISNQYEYNQMNWDAVSQIYAGFRFSINDIRHLATDVDQLVKTRNDAAHQGKLPATALSYLEQQTRANASMVEVILTDITIQLLSFFLSRLHLR